MLPKKILKIMFSKLAEIDFPGITFTKKFKVRNWLDLVGSNEISTHARETTQKSVSLIANPRDLATMTMDRYTKYWFVNNTTESFTSFVLFFLYVLIYYKIIKKEVSTDWCNFIQESLFVKNDTKSSSLIFNPLRFFSCLVKILALVRN